jgi:hypothetical protein
MTATAAVRVWQMSAATPDGLLAPGQRPADFIGTCLPSRSGVLYLEVVSGVPTGDPSATFVVEGRGAYELLRREGAGSAWGVRRLHLTLRPRPTSPAARPQD